MGWPIGFIPRGYYGSGALGKTVAAAPGVCVFLPAERPPMTPVQAAVAVGVTAGTLVLVLGAPIWGGILAFAAGALAAKQAIQSA